MELSIILALLVAALLGVYYILFVLLGTLRVTRDMLAEFLNPKNAAMCKDLSADDTPGLAVAMHNIPVTVATKNSNPPVIPGYEDEEAEGISIPISIQKLFLSPNQIKAGEGKRSV